MITFFKILLYIKYLSNVFPVVLFIVFRQMNKSKKYLLIFLLGSLLLSISERLFGLAYGNTSAIIHFTFFLRFILALTVLYRISKFRIFFYTCLLLGSLLFIYETFILKLLHHNNELMTVYVNTVITIWSLTYLINSKRINDSESKYNFMISGTFLLISGSSLILSVYESDIRSSPTYAAFFLILYYNLLEILQYFGITYSLWKLREA
jgi:hypothetical protein